MTEIRFYHMERTNLLQTLPGLLTKAIGKHPKILVKGADEKQIETLNEHLWTYDPNSFLPHGSKKDGHAAEQPIFLTTEDENANDADLLILVGGASAENINAFTLVCEMLDGHNDNEISSARARWKDYKEQGFEVTYWQQSQTGGWDQKA